MRLSRHKLNLTASVTALLAATAAAPAFAGGLPINGSVATGNASIAGSGNTLTINQTTANAVINWQSFDVGAGNTVRFVQPDVSSATLNRVTGNTTSVIAGQITANGSVYLINPNGIQITSTGAISVGRGFVASTFDLADADFVAGKGTFTGHGGSITHAGTITTQTGGFVGLLAGNVATSGSILAPSGHVVIGAGTLATLDINGGGFLQVELPGGAALSADGSAALVSGAAARDAVRNIVNLPGTINAQSVSGTSGSIDLGGTINVDAASGNGGHIMVLGNSLAGHASLSARALGVSGNGGTIETSGNTVDFTGFTITTAAVHGRTGTWLLDPLDLTIDAAGAAALSTALASNSVILQTTGTSDATGTASATGSNTAVNPSAYGTASNGTGNINITSAVSWSSSNSLTLQAFDGINITAPITAALGGLVLTAGNGVAQTGAITATAGVSVGTFSLTNGNWAQNTATLPTFSATDFSFDAVNASFLRVTGGLGTAASPYQISDVYGLQGINSALHLSASFVLANNIDATGTSKWNAGTGFAAIGIDAADALVAPNAGGSGFTGSFNGQGHTINGVTIKQASSDNIGVFGYVDTAGAISNVGVTAVSITANSNGGGLVGQNLGTISNSYATGTLTEGGAGITGGLVGLNAGTISGGSYAAVTVSGTDTVGGLVGSNSATGSITNSHATGAVAQTGSVGAVGGLAGQNYGSIVDSYATGAVHGSTVVGGLVGLNAGGAGVTGSYATGLVTGTDVSTGITGGLVGENAGHIANGSSGGSYATGVVNGTINVGGLVGQQDITGSIVGAFATGKVTGTGSNVGGLVGAAFGSISKSYATGAVAGKNFVGGLVGANYGSIADTYATGSATAGAIKSQANVGGLVGQSAAIAGGPTPTITRSYASGLVKSTVAGATAIGGLIGSNLGTISASFYNDQTTGQGDANGGSGLNTSGMETLSVFSGAGWSIDDTGSTSSTWRIYGGNTAPLLRLFLTPLTVSANNSTITYDGAAHSATGYTAPGGANAANILGTPSVGTASGTNAGTYDVSLSGLYSNQQGYDLTLTPGKLTINPASLTISADLKSRSYGAANPVFSFSQSGLIGTDALTGSLTTTATAASNAGTYGITLGTLSAGSNYTISYVGNNLVVNPANLTVTYNATPKTSTFGTTPSGLTGVVATTGLVNGDTLAGVTIGTAQWTTTATAASNVGTYAITGSGLSASSGNYTFTFAQGAGNNTALTITQKALTAVTVGLTGSITKVYDGTLAATLTSANYVLSGFVNGDGATVNQTVGTYASANVGSGITVTANLSAANFVANAGTDLGNYSLPTTATGNIGAITPASVTVTYNAAPVSNTFGATPAGLAGSLSAVGIVDGKAISAITTGSLLWGTTATAASNVGRYAVTGSGLSGNDGNYTVSFAQSPGNATALVVNPATLTVTYTANAATSIYGTTPSGLTGSVVETGLVNGDVLANVTGGTASWSATNANSTSHVGHYTVSGNGISTTSANYIINAVQAAGNATALTINPASLSVIANAQTRSYGAANPVLSYSSSGLVNGDTLSGSLATSATTASHVGNYGITLGTLSAGSDYTIGYTGANLAVTPASLTVTYTANAATSTYGTTPAGLTGAVVETGLLNGDTLADVISGTATWATSATSTSNVGHYGVTGSGLASASADYTINALQAAGNAAALTVNPASLTVTYNADGKNVVYGTTPSGLTGTVATAGLVNGDTLAGVTTGTAAWTTTATSASNVGSYAITGSGLTGANSNYQFTFAQGAGNATALTISKAPLIVVTAGLTGSITKVYDGTLAATLTSANYVLSGFVTGQGATVNQTAGTYASANVGSGISVTANLSAANFVANAGTDLGNYSLPTSATGNIGAITPASVTVSYNAASASSTYGTTPGGLTGSLSAVGIVDGKSASAITTGSLLWGTTATSASGVGSYAVTGSGLSGNDSNYTVSFAQGAGNASALTINPASLTVTYNANSANSTYGTTPGGLGGAVAETGLVNGDSLAEVLNGTAQWATTATATSNVGAYAITGSGLSGDSANYSVHFVQGLGNASALTIDPATLSVIANAQTRSYGAANPVLTYSATGLVNGDTLSGSLATTATAASHVGNYGITLGTLSAGSNYTLGFTGANLAVTPASLTVTYTASAATSTYGSAPAGLTGSVAGTGLLNGDVLANVIGGTATWATTATAASNVGQYGVTGSGITSTSADYTINAGQAAGNATALTVNPASLTVTYTATAATSTYGTTPAGLTGSVAETGLVNGDSLANVVSGTANWTTTASSTSHVGHYGVTGSGIASANANYTINAVQAAGNAGALTINPASLAVIANAQTRSYGAANPALTYSTTGLVNGDTLSGSLATTATAASHVGSYGITLGTLSAGNDYTLGYTGANLAVTPASLTLTYNATAASSTYGSTPAGLTGAIGATGLLNGDTLAGLTSGTASWTTTATATSGVGVYAITGSGLTAVAGGDYTIAFAQSAGNATALTVNPASLTVTYNANTATSTYGATPTGLTGSVVETGLVNGDTLAAVVSGTAQWTTTAGARSNVGAYAIAGSGLAGSNANYAVHFVQGLGNATALTINPASLAVIANAQTRSYGAANPTLTYSATGLVNGDTLSGALVTTATAASNVGSYGITLGTLSAGSNYTLGFSGANLAVTPASLTLTYNAMPANFVTGTPLTGLTGSVSGTGLVNGDTVASVTNGTVIWTTLATSASNPGAYAIMGSGLVAHSTNYTFAFAQNPANATALTISPASSQFGSNTLGHQDASGANGDGSDQNQTLNGNNDVSQLNLDTGAAKDCQPGVECPATH
ncbi:MBG domain-containing protein [Novosphingobium sp.]|uniref:MBG domain-containing protein n=1 Tax=Novosphingobium sp. TaxID=1874826 RepID=UPI00333E2C86